MTVPRLTALREVIFKTVPATVPVDNDNLQVQIAWDTQPGLDTTKPIFVVGLAPLVDATRVANAYESSAQVTATITNEAHTYANEATTLVDEMDIGTVSSVTGTAGGSPKTFINGIDFDVVDSDGDGALDGLTWKIGGTKPDNGTQVLITYTHYLLQDSRSHLFRQTVIVNAIAVPVKTGQIGATQTIQATQILESMQLELTKWFEASLRPALEAESIVLDNTIGASPPHNVSKSAHVQAIFTFTVWFQEDITLGTVRRVRKITTQETVESA